MSLYYSLIFTILVAEIFMFSLLALPIPTKYRKPLTLVIIKPFKNTTVQVTVKCILAFILLLFADSINKVYNINAELHREFSQGGPERIEVLSRKFYHQRNMYLTGITLFLTFIVTRTFDLVDELLKLKAIYRSNDNAKIQSASSSTATSNTAKRDELLNKIKQRDEEIALLKEKAAALQKDM